MNVAQNVSAIFNSPQIAEMALQAVQAGELAERQGLARLRLESERREHQVTGPQEGAALEAVAERPTGGPPEPPLRVPRRRAISLPKEGPAPEAAGSDPGDTHRIDLMA